MVVIEKRCDARQSFDDRLILPFELRQKSRLRTRLESGEEVGVFLERGTVLRGGDALLANDGRHIKVEAKPEQLYRVTCADTQILTRAVYHLGNRHVPVQVGDGWLLLERDAVLRDMLLGLGVEVIEVLAPFEPETGAYGAHGNHSGET